MDNKIRTVRTIRTGDPITSKFLNDLGSGVNSLKKPIPGPHQNDELPPAGSDAVPNYVFSETSRATTEVQVFDQNLENYALIDRITSITFKNNQGEILRLDFNG